MILVDTSAWVEFDRATGSAVDDRLTELIATTDDVVVTEPIMMEVLAGARTPQRAQDLESLLRRFALARFDPTADFDAAARIYRRCRAEGVTPRGMVDCMITAVAAHLDLAILTIDHDLVQVAGVMGVRMDRG